MRWEQKESRKPQIIRATKHVGKTTLIRDLVKQYKHVVMFNLEKMGDRRYFEEFDDIHTIIETLFLANDIPSSATSETLLFIDEIQEVPKAIQLLRCFYEELPSLMLSVPAHYRWLPLRM